MNCIFCKIISGEADGKIIYQDNNTTVFATIDPVSKGHTLIVPNKHVEQIYDLSDDQAAALLISARKTSEILRNKYGATGINILHASGKDAQQSVWHFHLHLVPRYPKDNLDLWIKQGL